MYTLIEAHQLGCGVALLARDDGQLVMTIIIGGGKTVTRNTTEEEWETLVSPRVKFKTAEEFRKARDERAASG